MGYQLCSSFTEHKHIEPGNETLVDVHRILVTPNFMHDNNTPKEKHERIEL